jgi:glycosyltransferase involved in cell wall biosynthesis
MTPALSVVTATLNRREMTARAVRSVIAQGLDGVEHIVVDGGSTDGTREMLAGFPHLRVIAEPDRNLYEAWNKGIARATGRLVVILNSDDEIPPGAFAAACKALAARPDAEMLCGIVEIDSALPDGGLERRVMDAPGIMALREQDVRSGLPLINGRYLARGLLARVGPFDERYPTVSDQDWLMRALLAGARRVPVTHPLYRYLAHAGSLTLRPDARRTLAEESLAAASAGLMAARGGAARLAYRRWHAWASFYAAGLALREGRAGAAFGIASAAFAADPFWPSLLPPQVVRHWRERAMRRGTLLPERVG